jgi:hypothetical protein
MTINGYGSQPNSLTPKADVIALLLQLKHPVQDQSVGIYDGLRVDINSNTLIHCLGCWRKLEGVARVLSETGPFFGTYRILCKVLFCLGSLLRGLDDRLRTGRHAWKKTSVEKVSVSATNELFGYVSCQSAKAFAFAPS